MILSIKIDDETYRKYAEKNQRFPQRAIERTVKEYAEKDPTKRDMVISGECLKKLEKIYGTTLSDKVEDFVRWVDEMNQLRVETEDLRLTKNQVRRLKAEAGKVNRTFEEQLHFRVKGAVDTFIGV